MNLPLKRDRAPKSFTPWKMVIAAALLGATGLAAAQAWPSKPVTVIVPFPPGGAVDPTARLLTEPLGKLLGQSFVVDNKVGAAGNIGYGVAARAPKDGSTVLFGYSATTACSPALYPNLGWDPVKDFTAVGMVAVSPLVVAVHPSVPANNLREFIAYAKQQNGQLNYGTAGIGSLAHIATEMMLQSAGVSMLHVPFKGTGELIPNLLSGRLQMGLQGPPSVKQHVQAGKLKALAVTGTARDPILPDVPTAAEAGLPGFAIEGWMGFFVPAGTPPQVVTTLADALKRVTDSPEIRQRALAAGVDLRYQAPEATAARVRKDIDECKAAIVKAGIKLE